MGVIPQRLFLSSPDKPVYILKVNELYNGQERRTKLLFCILSVLGELGDKGYFF
jgi:hypothetical protein